MMRLVDAARLRPDGVVFLLVAVVAGAGVGAIGARSSQVAFLVVAGLLLLALTVYRPVALAVIALVGVFAVQRLGSTHIAGGGKPGASYSDVLLGIATFFAIPALLGTKHIRRLRLAGWGLAIYLACLLPTLILNSAQRGYIEWLHRLVLVGGSLLVGAWIAREGQIRVAIRWLTFIACIVALATLVTAVRHGWAHSAPFGMQKNFVGSQLAAVFVLIFVAPKHLGLTTRRWAAVVCIIGAGLVASHSRGAALAATVGLFLAVVLQGRLHRRSTKLMAVLVAAVLSVFVYTTVRHQLDQSQTLVNHGSIGVRFNVERVTRDIWRTSPIYGVGLKYFSTHDFGQFAVPANNDVDNELAESGVIGLVGFVFLQLAVLIAGLRRGRTDQLAAAAFGVVAGLLAHGMVDIYWTAGTVTLPFIVMGMALARDPSDQIRPPTAGKSPAQATSGPRGLSIAAGIGS